MSTEVEEAMKTMKQAMKSDPDFAWSWHCNIAMMCKDAGATHKISNFGAARFMKLAFDVDTSEHPNFSYR